MTLARLSLCAAALAIATQSNAFAQDHTKPTHSHAPRRGAAQTAVRAAPHVIKSETQSFDAWTVVCETLSEPANERRCIARLPVVKSDTRRLITMLTFTPMKADETQLVIQIPTSIMVQAGGALTLKGGEPRKFPILSCQPALCTGSLTLDAATSQALAAASDASLSWTAIGGAPVKVDFALKGAGPAMKAALGR